MGADIGLAGDQALPEDALAAPHPTVQGRLHLDHLVLPTSPGERIVLTIFSRICEEVRKYLFTLEY